MADFDRVMASEDGCIRRLYSQKAYPVELHLFMDYILIR
jgi:hypothetical protein